MVTWFSRKRVSLPEKSEWGNLQDAVEQAKKQWQMAEHAMRNTEEEEEIDDAIYYLLLTEKRYMYLLDRARAEYSYSGRQEGGA
ncbi:DUF2508 family protein [Brevibacillus sp. B_LB10_24]|uniref:DUF2508 family protein n=1 Tax=Brevibacillus sp. B_LB10_24 TaxID=3380645 RepID=UPI0038BC5178